MIGEVNLLLAIGTIWKRELIRFFRQKARLFGAFGTPLIFWLVIGSGLGSSFQAATTAPGMNYLEFFYPGTILLIILFTTIFSSLSIIEDRNEGFLLSVLVAPVSRHAIVLGKILGSATVAMAQGVLLLLLGPFLGISLGVEKFLILCAVVLLLSLCLSGLGFAAAWKTGSMQGYHSVMNVLLFPMWLLSGAVFPGAGAFSWVRWVMTLKPLTYALSTLRHFLYGTEATTAMHYPSLSVSLAVTILFGLAVFAISFLFVSRGKVTGLG